MRTLEYDTTKEECTLESKSCLESGAAPKPAPGIVDIGSRLGHHILGKRTTTTTNTSTTTTTTGDTTTGDTAGDSREEADASVKIG